MKEKERSFGTLKHDKVNKKIVLEPDQSKELERPIKPQLFDAESLHQHKNNLEDWAININKYADQLDAKIQSLKDRIAMIPKTISVSTMKELERMLNDEKITYTRFVELINQSFEDRHQKLRAKAEKMNADIQSLKDELEEIKESGEFQHGLDSGVYVAKTEIEKLQSQIEELTKSKEKTWFELSSKAIDDEIIIKQMKHKIKELETTLRSNTKLYANAVTQQDDKIKELSRERVLIKSEAKRQKGNGHNCDLTILIEQLLNSK